MGKLMAGFFFLFLDFNLSLGETVSINLLPEFVGFLFLCAGFAELCDESPRLMKLHPVCIVMAVLQGIVWFGNLIGFSAYILNTAVGVGFSLALTIITYWITNRVIAGIADMEEANGFEIGAGKLKTIWLVLVIAHGAAWLAGALYLIVPTVIAVVVSFVAMIWFLAAFYGTKKQYEAMKEIKEKERLRALDLAQEQTED